MSGFHIIGDEETVLGYRFAGVTGDVVTTREEALAAFQGALENPKGGILLLTEAVEDMLAEEVKAHRLAAKPPYLSVVEDIWGNHGKKRKSLKEMIGEAVGIRI